MAELKLVTWNMEWLNDLFTSQSGGAPAAFRPDGDVPQHDKSTTVGKRKDKLRLGLERLEADVIVVIEGPSSPDELQLLFDTLAPGQWVTHLQVSKSLNAPHRKDIFTSTQNVGIAVRVDTGKFANPPMTVFDAMDPQSGDIFTASEPFFLDSGANGVFEWYRYERRPAYVEITMHDGASFRVMGVHLKSKGIFTALEWSQWWTIADANRERLLAQCRQLREAFLDRYLSKDPTRQIPLIVCGDINDGPGFDTSEMRLKASGVETLMGSIWQPDLALGNALYDALPPKDQARLNFEDNYTTSFEDPIFDGQYQREWIDHILYSRNAPPGWVHDGKIIRSTGGVPDTPFYRISDHFPVQATITLPAPQP